MTGDKTAYCQCLGRAGEPAAGGRRAGRGAEQVGRWYLGNYENRMLVPATPPHWRVSAIYSL